MTSEVGRNLNWRVESVRLTAFMQGPAAVGLGWESVVGEPPEMKSEKPREGVSDQRGGFAGGQLVFTSQPTRVDWQWEADLTSLILGEVVIGLTDGLDRLKPVADKWLGAASGVHRLALGAVLSLPVSDRDYGYETLQRYAPSLKLGPGKTSEVFFQINRPRPSKAVSGLELNRLTKWHVSQRFPVSVQIAIGGAGNVQTGSVFGESSYSCRLELDLSTDAQRTETFAADTLADLWKELGILAVEIAEKGETP